MIEVADLSVAYGTGRRRVLAVDRVSLSVPTGEMAALVGPSGCGKSTILYAVDGLIPPTEGTIRIGDEPVHGVRRDVALILQDAGLLPWKTVRQNAELALRIQGVGDDVADILNTLGLTGFETSFPSELSEGMKRRVGIARALALHPRVLLMDEPMANLDSLTRERIQILILDLWRSLRFTALLVTHDIEEAVFLGRHVFVLSRRPARVVETLANPEAGTDAYRGSDTFMQRVRYLHELLGGVQ